LPAFIETSNGGTSGSDRDRDQIDRDRDRIDRDGDQIDRDGDQIDRDGDQTKREPFVRKPGHQYARRYPDPLTGHPLQIYPSRGPGDFDSMEDFLKVLEAVNRYNNGLPPPVPVPEPEALGEIAPVARLPRPASRFKPSMSRHLGLRLTESDFAQLKRMAAAHSVRPGTMARMLVVRAIRAAAEAGE
jgi:hypothetical protein